MSGSETLTAAGRSTGPPVPDAELVVRARSGEIGAFEGLVARHQGATRALGYAIIGDWAEAEDLSQEAFLRAFRNLDLLADPGSSHRGCDA